MNNPLFLIFIKNTHLLKLFSLFFVMFIYYILKYFYFFIFLNVAKNLHLLIL